MTPRLFFTLGALAGISLAAVGAVSRLTAMWSPAEATGAAVLPGLADAAAEVAALKVTSGTKTLELTRDGDEWSLASKGGYPADPKRVRASLVALGEMTRFEPKTANPALYEKLGVEDPASAGATSNLVELNDASGREIAQIILGNTRRGVERATQDGTFVRLPGEDRTWLAAGAPRISTDLAPWIETRLLDVTVSQVTGVTVRRGVTFPIELTRIEGGDKGFAIAAVPEGMTARTAFGLQTEVRKITEVQFDDLRPASTSGEPFASVEISVRGGLEIAVDVVREAGMHWLRIAATGNGETAEWADRLNARFGGWEVRLSDQAAEDFVIMLVDVIDAEKGAG